LTAKANDRCTGSNVLAQAAAYCPGITHPAIAVSRTCPNQAVIKGQPLAFSGTVSNTGDVALVGVAVTDDHAGLLAQFAALAPGESQAFSGSYIPTNCGPAVATTVQAIGTDACAGGTVTNAMTVACPVICPPTIVNTHLEGTQYVFSFDTLPGHLYTVQFSPLVAPVNWQPLTSFTASAASATIHDPMTGPQRYYRVQMQ
jgi:hypothetical protein